MRYTLISVLLLAAFLMAGCPQSRQVTSQAPASESPKPTPETTPEPSEVTPPQTDPDMEAQIKALAKAWWLNTTPVPGKAEDEWVVDRFLQERQRVYDLLGKYQHVSPVAKSVAANYKGHLSIGWLETGQDISLHQPGEEVRGKIVFVPLDQDPSRFPMPIIFSEQIGGVMMMGYTFPDTVLAGIMFHELGHALSNQLGQQVVQGYATSFQDVSSEDQIQIAKEEIEMHTLEGDVFDAATDGAFWKAINEIVQPLEQSHTSWREVVNAPTPEQYTHIYGLLGATDYPHLHSLLQAVTRLLVGLKWIDAQSWDQPKKDSEKINLFLYLRTGI